MALSLILIVLAILGAVSLFLIARAHRSQPTDLKQLSASIRPVDLQAFQNLVSPRDEKFLIENLSPREFRRVQRLRVLAAIAYLNTVAGNAAALMRIGQLAQTSSDLEIVSAGRELGEAASHLRLYSVLALAKLYLGVLVPRPGFSPASIAETYELVTHRVSRLSGLRVAVGAPGIRANL